MQHKEHCTIHRGKKNVISTLPSINRRTAIVPAATPTPVSTQNLAASRTDTMSNRSFALLEHGRCRATWKQQMNPGQVMELDLNAVSASPAEEHLVSVTKTMKTKIQCPCGQSFAKGEVLNMHLRCSKTHLGGKHMFEPRSKATTPGSVPLTARSLPPTSVPPAYTSVSGTIPSSKLSIAPPARNKPGDDSLISSLASLNLDSVSTRARPLVASSVCMCGRTFTDQEALEQHKGDARRLAWQGKRKTTVEVFNTPRPQYHEDEHLQNMSVALTRQHSVGEYWQKKLVRP